MPEWIHISPKDNVAVALANIPAHTSVDIDGATVELEEDITQGHKFAVQPIAKDSDVVKYGFPIGHATQDIEPGQWVHTHNLATNLSASSSYRYQPTPTVLEPVEPECFMGYLRADGRAAIRNELWIIPTVGCINGICAQMAADNAHLVKEYGLDGVYAFNHPYGCSQMGGDHETTKQYLAALANHPNAGGVLIVGLGCENNTMDQFKAALNNWNQERVHFIVCQEEADEMTAAAEHLQALAQYAGRFKRQPVPVSELVVGLKCGGSDGLSGITANPLLGRFSDMLAARGGSAVLTEVPEMFGAEDMLFSRCESQAVFDRAVGMVDAFKQYFVDHGQVVYENPSPGNKQGGISTLEDKSLGCVQKGGNAPVCDVVAYGGQVQKKGLTLLSGPGNDLVSVSALAAAGAHLVLFTTGRGTPFGGPVPTVKVSSNTPLFHSKSSWIDFNAGAIAEGEPMEAVAGRLYQYVLSLASGDVLTHSEKAGFKGLAIFKDGVTL